MDLKDEDLQGLGNFLRVCHEESEKRGWHEPDKTLRNAAAGIEVLLRDYGEDIDPDVLKNFEQTLGELEKLRDASRAPVYAKLLLMVTEIAEAAEWTRSHPELDPSQDYAYVDRVVGPDNKPVKKLVPYAEALAEAQADGRPLPKPEGLPSELADVMIRIGDDALSWKIDLTAAIRRKMAYNATRAYRHGGKAV